MKRKIALDDYVLFLAVAEGGGLASAARRAGSSVPTLSRRMQQFERQIGLRLFHRGSKGYSLTADGVALRDEALQLQAVMTRLEAFGQEARKARVRITAGMWTARFLARRIAQVWSPAADWVPEFLPSGAVLDIARRVADIGVRNHRPEQTWLAGLRTGETRFAPFAATPTTRGWIALADRDTSLPSQSWVHRNHGENIVTMTSDPRLGLDLAEAGIGQVVLPLFAAEETSLVQTDAEIAELTREEWLVVHQDARHDPPIRLALDAIQHLLKTKRPVRARPR